MAMRARCAAIVALMLALAGLASAQSTGGNYGITRAVIAGGGARAIGGDYTAVTTIGQPAPGTQSGGDFVLRGGFHVVASSAAPRADPIFSHDFEN